jgi:hypothetical protein
MRSKKKILTFLLGSYNASFLILVCIFKGKNILNVELIDKGDDPMNKTDFLKSLRNASRSNLFSIEIPKATKEDEKIIEVWVEELESEGKIKLRECVQREYSIYLHGIIKYAPE